ncbi:DNA (cytosine-5-)-methyltransferase [Marinobacter salinus]|uniref:DNA (cytosine-5-)-methyltransferase n=2 Tax=Marinobacter salinus TaxID=1874317 RepID=A0A1D9GRF1_9GAMM|nr:DNA (cytosine-5-)-methyltransferase [Marinobacter salinus]
MKAVELFTGAGGLGMGVSLAGFSPLAVVERDRWACDTIRQNQSRGNPIVNGWPLYELDVRHFSYEDIDGEVDLVAGGPPCQPFSQGGRHRAFLDERDMFPETVRAIRELKPKAFIIENVKGLTRKTFAEYFNYIRLQLEFPEVVARENEEWLDHLGRLERYQTSGSKDSSTYEVVFRVLNAANYGVPQKRERIFFVGFRHDLHVEWTFPQETHSYDALLHSQWVTGEYWDYHGVAKKDRPSMEGRLRNRVEKLNVDVPSRSRWNTVRDALKGMPDPEQKTGEIFLNHKFQPGARTYPGHTGSPIDLPAKTLKAGVHGVPGGENMLVKPSGEVRYFTVRESARLQTFPDTYIFHGSWTETMRQLGNAVPLALGQRVASSVAQALLKVQEDQLKKSLAKARLS